MQQAKQAEGTTFWEEHSGGWCSLTQKEPAGTIRRTKVTEKDVWNMWEKAGKEE